MLLRTVPRLVETPALMWSATAVLSAPLAPPFPCPSSVLPLRITAPSPPSPSASRTAHVFGPEPPNTTLFTIVVVEPTL